MKALLLIAVLLSGCATGSIEVVKPNGEICRANYYSLFKDMESFKATACRAKAEVLGSKVAAEQLQKLVEALSPFLAAP